jgi:predicted ATPase/serine/threonine protein kinase
MSLPLGTRLGPFEILTPLGAGGMGEVYRAWDTRLERTVAIKVLPERLSQNAEQRARLENEARAISKLAHPNICTLHDISHHEGRDFLVLELVQGVTLRQLLAAGPVPTRKAIPIAVQVAEGLARAHELGIVHRDLKPENLMVSGDTIVKILDFGLAKLELNPNPEESVDPDSTGAFQTQAGAILGTLGYMSPEQAGGGGAVDFRSDQFSFGLVMYEMLTGKRPFRRASVAETLAATIHESAEPISSLNPEVPPPFCWVVERCLNKDPEKRYFSTLDLARDLVAIRDRLSDLTPNRTEARPSNLPAPSSAFVGRDKELAAAKELLLRDDVRLVTATGPGGIGKSRLALEVARAVKEEFPAGVYFVPLAAVKDPGLLAFTIARTLGIRETANQSALETLREYLQSALHAPALLLVDNFEHMVEAATTLAGLLAVTPHLKLLVTSRAALRVHEEREFPVPPLALPDARAKLSTVKAGEYSAISLFVQRAAAVKPNFALTEENAPIIAEICTRLDGLPLAIELAAARIKLLSPAAMRARLETSLQLLTGGARDLPERQQTLRQAIDWSYDLLSEPEQRLFRRLSVFLGGCSLEAVESVCDTKQDLGVDVLDGMASLVDKSLVRQIEQADGETRFVMLETIREYARGKMSESGEEAATRRSHAAYCLVLAEEAAAENAEEVQTGWMERLESESQNIRAALEYLIEASNAEWGLRLGVALFRFWERRELLTEAREWFGKLLNIPSGKAPLSLRVRALFCAGVLASEQRDYPASVELLNKSLEIARELEDARSVAVSLNALAVVAGEGGDLPGARSLCEESLVQWRLLGDAQAVARGLSNLAGIANLQHDGPGARALYEESLAIFRELNDRSGVAWALNHQGDVARDHGDSAAASDFYQRSLADFRELGDGPGVAGCLADLGHLARAQQDYAAADALYRESLGIFRELDHKRGMARLLEAFACSAAAQAEAERGLRLAGAAAALRQSIGAPLTADEQSKLERGLEPARKGLPTTAGRTAWLEGWVTPVGRAIEDVLGKSSSESR